MVNPIFAMLPVAAAGAVAAITLSACTEKEVKSTPKSNYAQAVALTKETTPSESWKTARGSVLVEVWKDSTGCEYLIIDYGKAITPRMETVGNLHRQKCN